MAKDKHLSKDEELRLGGLVQDMIQAKEALTSEETLTEENKLAYKKQVREGEKAVARLVVAYTGLVHSKAKAFKSHYPGAPELDDLIQDGMAGLLTAIYRYDPSLGNKVSTVASYWIYQSISRWTNKTGRLVKLPENRVSDFSRISMMRAELDKQGFVGQEADEVIMDELNLSKDDIFYITNAAATPASLNKVVSSDGSNTYELLDIVTRDHTSESSEDAVLKTSIFSTLNEHMNELSDVQREVVAAAFMLDASSPDMKVLSPKEVREKHSLSPARAKKILNESLRTIKAGLDEIGISYEDFLE